MVKIDRDKDGKTRVAKGDKSGLGGQYAPDPAKIVSAQANMGDIPLLVEDDMLDVNGEPKTVYEIWYTRYDYDSGVLGYAPVFEKKAEAEEWIKEFFANEDVTSEIKSLDVVGVMQNPDDSFAGYADETTVDELGVERDANGYCVNCAYKYCECVPEPASSETVDEECSMSLEEMIALVKQEWDDAKSDDGRIWAKTYDKLKEAREKCPNLYSKAVAIAQEEVREMYRKAGLI
jgi:hypothetical protein